MTYRTVADVGHRFLVEPRGTALFPDEKEILSELRPRAFMFRARNFDFRAPYDEWLSRFSALLEEIRVCVGTEKLLLSIDHEGGRVVRPPKPITRFPYAAKWGSKVEEVSHAMAIELRSLGLNTSWAPVVDVLTNPNSKAIGQRAFSDDPAVVIRDASIMARVLEQNGIAAAAKHFPGYGPVTEDAHYALPVADIPLEEWESVHLPPFVELVRQGIRFLMTAHIMCPALDPADQATLSKTILVDLLRQRFGFQGVVFADALGMGAIRDQIEGQPTVEKALLAELDIFFIAGDSVNIGTALTLGELILKALREGRIVDSLLDRSRLRIDSAFEGLPQHKPERLSDAVLLEHAELAHELDPNDEYLSYQYIPKGFD